MKTLTIIGLNVFGLAILSPAFLHSQISEQREASPIVGTLVLSHAEIPRSDSSGLDSTNDRSENRRSFRTQTRLDSAVYSVVPSSGLRSGGRRLLLRDGCDPRLRKIRALVLTVQQLGQQWLENNAGSWGSSEQSLLLLKRGIKPPDTGSPRYNKLWWTIGPQFSSDVYGVLNPGMPNAAAEIARRLGHINGYAEGTDGAAFVAGMVSFAFVEKDTVQLSARQRR